MPLAQAKELFKRSLLTYWRTSSYNLIRFLITIFVGLVFGSLYYQIGMNRCIRVENHKRRHN